MVSEKPTKLQLTAVSGDLRKTKNSESLFWSWPSTDAEVHGYSIRERQLRLYGHVPRLPAEDPAHQILSCRDPSGWTMPRGRPQASCLHQMVLSEEKEGKLGANAMKRVAAGAHLPTPWLFEPAK